MNCYVSYNKKKQIQPIRKGIIIDVEILSI